MTIETSNCPVSQDFYPLAAGYLADPYPALDRLRAEAPVFHSAELDMWVVTRHADIEAIFTDTETFSAAIVQDPVFPPAQEAREILAEGFEVIPTMSNCAPPKHTRIRRHNMKAFSARRMAKLEPWIRDRASQLIEAMAPGGQADFVAGLAFPLPALTIFRLIGFPDSDTEMLKSWCGNRMNFSWGRPSPAEQAQVARDVVAYRAYCGEFVARRLAEPADDFTSDLVRAHLADPETLTVEEITSVVYGLSFAGHETTTSLLSNTLRQMLTHREQWERLCASPELVPDAVEETLRYDTSVIAWRRVTTRPVAISDVEVPEGAKLMLMLGAAGRDPAAFADPDTFDIARDDARNHLAFGKGIHFCLGAALARMEVRIVLELLTERMPSLRLAPEQQLSFPPNISFRGPERLLLTWDEYSVADAYPAS